LLQHIDQLIEQAADENSRAELERLKARLNTPEMLDMARDLAGSRRARPEELVLEFHDPLLPTVLTAAGCVIATAVCLFAVVDGFKSSTAFVGGTEVNLWLVAAFAGALSVAFSALSFVRTFSVRVDARGISQPIRVMVPERTRALAVVARGGDEILYGLAWLETADGIEHVRLPDDEAGDRLDLGQAMREQYREEGVGAMPGALVDVSARRIADCGSRIEACVIGQ
jgi:hypothetical protein